MEARTVEIGRTNNLAAFEALNGKGLPVVLERFMTHMFGGGGYKVRRAEGRENVYEFNTTLCHYEVAVENDGTAWVKAWPRAPRRGEPGKCRYDRMSPTAMWKIRAGDGEEAMEDE